jgi:hypothetical protein
VPISAAVYALCQAKKIKKLKEKCKKVLTKGAK